MTTGYDDEKPQACPTPQSGEISDTGPDKQPSNEAIHGWLSLFLFLAGAGVVGSVGIFFWNIDRGAYLADSLALTFGGIAIDILLLLAMAAAYGYMLYSFLRQRPNAVAVGKLYLAFIFATQFIAMGAGMAFGFDEQAQFGTSAQVVRGLFWSSAWFLFLCRSKQVRRLFPIENRVVMQRDKIWFGAMIGWSIVALSVILTVYSGAL